MDSKMLPHVAYGKLSSDSTEDEDQNWERVPHDNSGETRRMLWLVLILLVSNTITGFFTRRFYNDQLKSEYTEERTPYADLSWDTDLVFGGHNEYTDRNDTYRDQLWQSINVDDGMVALPYDFVDQKGLPVSQPFPWDHSKGIYLLHGYHNLHCTRNIYISLMEYRLGLPQTRNFRHVIHCLDALRRDVICNADDTPRWTSNSRIPETGLNQTRKCRNWDKLEKWAKDRNACYRYINETASPDEFPQIQRFVWCPEGSPYKAEVAKVFDVKWDSNEPKDG